MSIASSGWPPSRRKPTGVGQPPGRIVEGALRPNQLQELSTGGTRARRWQQRGARIGFRRRKHCNVVADRLGQTHGQPRHQARPRQYSLDWPSEICATDSGHARSFGSEHHQITAWWEFVAGVHLPRLFAVSVRCQPGRLTVLVRGCKSIQAGLSPSSSASKPSLAARNSLIRNWAIADVIAKARASHKTRSPPSLPWLIRNSLCSGTRQKSPGSAALSQFHSHTSAPFTHAQGKACPPGNQPLPSPLPEGAPYLIPATAPP